MARKILVVILSVVIGLFGILSTCAAFLFEDFNLVVRIAGIINGGFLVIGAWLLFKQRMSAVMWLFFSTILYFMIALYDGFIAHGTISMPSFSSGFYWSVGFRFLLVVVAYALVKGVKKDDKDTP